MYCLNLRYNFFFGSIRNLFLSNFLFILFGLMFLVTFHHDSTKISHLLVLLVNFYAKVNKISTFYLLFFILVYKLNSFNDLSCTFVFKEVVDQLKNLMFKHRVLTNFLTIVFFTKFQCIIHYLTLQQLSFINYLPI